MGLHGVSEDELRGVFAQVLSERMAKADWHHSYSDDHSVHIKGQVEISRILSDLRQLARLQGGMGEAKPQRLDHVPDYTYLRPEFFDRPALLNQDLKDLVMERDVVELKDLLFTYKCEGKEYVTYDTNTILRPFIRFAGFERADEAAKFAALCSEPAYPITVSTVKALNERLDIEKIPDKGKVIAEVKVACLEHFLKLSNERNKGLDFSR